MSCVETLNHADGSPYINTANVLKNVLNEVDIEKLFVSLTTEDDYALAFVIAV